MRRSFDALRLLRMTNRRLPYENNPRRSAPGVLCLDQILSQGYVAGRPGIGAQVEEITDLYQNYWQLPDGLRITAVSAEGLQSGDILTRINGQSICTTEDLYDVLRNCHIGQEVEVQVYRNKITQSFTITIHEEQF